MFSAVSPGVPTISLNTPEEDLKEDTVIQFNCSSAGGNPPPLMAWYRNGEILPNTSIVRVPPTTKFGTTSSILTWQLTHADFGANFSCLAKNKDISGSLVENSTSLLVKCKLSYLTCVNCICLCGDRTKWYGQNGMDKMVYGQNVIGQNGMDKMVRTKWYQ